MIDSKFQILLFGKDGCDKCKALGHRLERLLQKPEWAEFEKVYCGVDTEDGLVEFCQSECINPQRIPAFVVFTIDDTGRRVPVRRPRPGEADEVCGNFSLYHYVGLQTDYESTGVITPKMITHVLSEAKALHA